MQGISLLEPEQIPADRMLVATGFDSEVRSTGDGRGWQRAEVDGRPFRERNEFRVIHCGASTEILFPDAVVNFEPMPSNPSSGVCNAYSPAERAEKALRTLEQALTEPVYNLSPRSPATLPISLVQTFISEPCSRPKPQR